MVSSVVLSRFCGFSTTPLLSGDREGHSTAWALVVELHLWEALYNFPQAGFQSDHVLIQV